MSEKTKKEKDKDAKKNTEAQENASTDKNTKKDSNETKNNEDKKLKKPKKVLKLPRYMKLQKGSMWKDTDGKDASGKVIYAFKNVMVGRNPHDENNIEPPKDKFNNENLMEYGYIEDESIPWYIDLTDIPTEKLKRIIIAYNAGVLVRADPEHPPVTIRKNQKSDWKIKKDGARLFVGKNKSMFKKLQNLTIKQIAEFVGECPFTEAGRENLIDLLDYERRGYNQLSRPRGEVLDLIRNRLRKYGPGMSAIRKNEME